MVPVPICSQRGFGSNKWPPTQSEHGIRCGVYFRALEYKTRIWQRQTETLQSIRVHRNSKQFCWISPPIIDLLSLSPFQRKPEEPPSELEMPGPEKPLKPSHKAVALNAPPKGLSPAAACSAKLSPCCHPPKCSAPCTLPVCPAVVPRSPAVSPVPSQSSTGPEAEGKQPEGQPAQDYPKSLEPGRHSSQQ